MNDTQKSLLYMLSCAVNGITPDTAAMQAMDLEKLYRLAKFHSVRAAVQISLLRAGVQDKQFDQAYKKAVRKNIYLDMERCAILADLEKNGIWYMPMKGSVLKDLYPENGMREMSDNDVLFDADKQEQSKEIMLSHGYTAKHYGISNHDVYIKPPVLNFELHTSLFSSAHAEPLYKYYADTKRLLRKDEDNGHGYHFSDEDLYIYMTAHEWKHYNGSGTGIRSLMDCYVYCKIKGDALDRDYIKEQCRKLEIADFEQKRRALAIKVFSSEKLPELTQSEHEMLMFYLTAGTYGTIDNVIKKQLAASSEAAFWLGKIFPTTTQMAVYFPIVKNCILLYPIGALWHFIRAVTFRREKFKNTVKAVRKYGKQVQDSG